MCGRRGEGWDDGGLDGVRRRTRSECEGPGDVGVEPLDARCDGAIAVERGGMRTREGSGTGEVVGIVCGEGHIGWRGEGIREERGQGYFGVEDESGDRYPSKGFESDRNYCG